MKRLGGIIIGTGTVQLIETFFCSLSSTDITLTFDSSLDRENDSSVLFSSRNDLNRRERDSSFSPRLHRITIFRFDLPVVFGLLSNNDIVW